MVTTRFFAEGGNSHVAIISLTVDFTFCWHSVAQHFNSTGHNIADVQVQGMRLCTGNNIQRKQVEMRLIFWLGTVQPNGININFSYI